MTRLADRERLRHHDRTADQLTRAAHRLDALTMVSIMTATLATDGVVAAWEQLIRPVLGRPAPASDPGWAIVVERLLTRSISDAFATVRRPPAATPVQVLLACADEEQHTLPLQALAAALTEAGVGCCLLGACVPARALRDAADRCRPEVVAVWSQAPITAHASQLTSLLHARSRPVLVIALGPGWEQVRLPVVITRPPGLAEAVALMTDAGSARRPPDITLAR